MTYRPRSSVTTILVNLVGSSVVSAITQTPASGPLAPVTTPPISSASMRTAPPLFCCAVSPTGHGAKRRATPSTTKLNDNRFFGFIFPSLAYFALSASHILFPSRPSWLKSSHHEEHEAHEVSVLHRQDAKTAK